MLRRSYFQLSSTSTTIKHQIAVVGSGPSGCYVAQQLLKLSSSKNNNNNNNNNIHVDIYEKLPVPFGLSRYGVAPDHPEVKNVEKTFNTQLLEAPDKCTILCNIGIGTDISLQQLRQCYSAVVLATGCSGEKRLEIPGEGSLENVISSKRFVEWYNTVPYPQSSPLSCPLTRYLKIDEQSSDLRRKKVVLKPASKTPSSSSSSSSSAALEQVVLIGNGNVALDTARVLAASYHHWCTTDMNCFAVRELMSLANHNIKKVTLVARRGVEHAAFTTKEFREIANLDESSVKVVVEAFDLEAALERSAKENGGKPAQGLKRKLELMKKYEVEDFDQAMKKEEFMEARCVVVFRFGLTPKRMIPRSPSDNQVGGVIFDSKSSGSDGVAVALPADAVITCVGYQGERIRKGFPFDEKRRVIPTDPEGRVVILNNNNNKENQIDQFLYSAGWARNGPKGVILAALNDAKIVAKTILDDLSKWDEEYEKATTKLAAQQQQQQQVEEENNNNDPNLLVVEEEATDVATESGKENDETAETEKEEEEHKQQQETRRVMGTEGILTKLLNSVKSSSNFSSSSSSSSLMIPRGKYDLIDTFIANQAFPLGVSSIRRIWKVEIEKGVDLGKRMEKVGSVSDMLNLASGGRLARKTEDRLRGRPILGRQKGLELMGDYLDPKVVLADMSEEWMKNSSEGMKYFAREQQLSASSSETTTTTSSSESHQVPSKVEAEKFLSSPPTSSLLDKMEPNMNVKRK